MKQNNQTTLTVSAPSAASAASTAPALTAQFSTAVELPGYRDATGEIRFKMTNDYMFKIIFQHTEILKGLLCALLGLSSGEVASVTVKNPIIIGQTVVEKVFVLDIDVSLNGDTEVNIELQVDSLGDWNDRSLSYLCRSFDRLYRGEDYSSAKSVVHIGILDFNIFDADPEFYSMFKLMNVKNHQIYNDKLELRVLQLKRRELATEEDKARRLDRWASLFKATTWEEIKMLAQKDAYFDMAAHELYKSNADERIRKECEAREEYEFQMRRRQRIMDDLQARMKETEDRYTILQSKTVSLESKAASLEDKNASLESKAASLEDKNATLEDKNAALENEKAEMKANFANEKAEMADEIERLRLENERLKGKIK